MNARRRLRYCVFGGASDAVHVELEVEGKEISQCTDDDRDDKNQVA